MNKNIILPNINIAKYKYIYHQIKLLSNYIIFTGILYFNIIKIKNYKK